MNDQHCERCGYLRVWHAYFYNPETGIAVVASRHQNTIVGACEFFYYGVPVQTESTWELAA